MILKKMRHTLTPEAIHSIASKTHGFVGADLAALCREAALVALHRNSADMFKGGYNGREGYLFFLFHLSFLFLQTTDLGYCCSQ